MAGKTYRIGQYIFSSEADYRDALKDQKLIEELRKKVNFRNQAQVLALYRSMQSGKIRFYSKIGRDFDDEVYGIIESGRSSKESVKEQESVKEKETRRPVNKQIEKQAQKIIAKQNLRRRILIGLCALIAVCSLGYFGYYYYMSYRTERNFKELAELKEQPSDSVPDIVQTVIDEEGTEIVYAVLDEYKTLYNKNHSLIGWIHIDDTVIDYPVMQSSDSDYYLKHNFYQEYDNNGCIFLDPKCSIEKRNTNMILYGHHMKSGKMFGSLDKYASESFFENHRYIQFDTIYEKGTYEVMYVFRSRIYNEDEIVFKYYQFIDVDSEAEFYSNMNEMALMSLYDTGVNAFYGDQILTLSTCDYQEKNGRFVVVAKRIS